MKNLLLVILVILSTSNVCTSQRADNPFYIKFGTLSPSGSNTNQLLLEGGLSAEMGTTFFFNKNSKLLFGLDVAWLNFEKYSTEWESYTDEEINSEFEAYLAQQKKAQIADQAKGYQS